MPIDYEAELHDARSRIEELEAHNQRLTEAIANAVEHLGHDGCEPADLHDAVGAIDRLLHGKDVDCGNVYEGLALEVERVVSQVMAAHRRGQLEGSTAAFALPCLAPALDPGFLQWVSSGEIEIDIAVDYSEPFPASVHCIAEPLLTRWKEDGTLVMHKGVWCWSTPVQGITR